MTTDQTPSRYQVIDYKSVVDGKIEQRFAHIRDGIADHTITVTSEIDARDLIAKLSAWLDAPRLAARATAEVAKLRAELAELTVARDRLLAREHEDGRLHAQLRAEVAELRARPVLTVDMAERVISTYCDEFAATDREGRTDVWAEVDQARRDHAIGVMKSTIAKLGAVTLPAQDRAEELAAAFMNERAARGKFMTWAELTDADRAKMTDAARVALASLGAPPTSRDTVRDAMERAAERFGGPDGVFSGAGFSNALMHAAGLSGAVDGRLVRAILAGRCDVQDRGNGHYQIAPSPTSPPAARPVFAAVSDEELVAAFAQAHLECPCDESGEEWAKYPPNCCNAAGARAVRAKLGAAEVTEERLAAALIEIRDERSLRENAREVLAYLRAAAAKGG